jgi:hypothetical protein
MNDQLNRYSEDPLNQRPFAGRANRPKGYNGGGGSN